MYDQYDKFYEEISSWDLHTDIVPVAKTLKNQESHIKHTFYSPDEYSHFQKQQVFNDLKQISAKNLNRLIPFKQDPSKTHYQLVHCSIVKKFFVLELNNPQSSFIGRDGKPRFPTFNQNDYVLIHRYEVSRRRMNPSQLILHRLIQLRRIT